MVTIILPPSTEGSFSLTRLDQTMAFVPTAWGLYVGPLCFRGSSAVLLGPLCIFLMVPKQDFGFWCLRG